MLQIKHGKNKWHIYNTRTFHKIRIADKNKVNTQVCFYHKVMKYYNTLPETLKTIGINKKDCKKHIKQEKCGNSIQAIISNL